MTNAVVFDLAHLSHGMPGLTSARGTALAEATAVCLEAANHVSGVVLNVIGDDEDSHELIWQATTLQQQNTYADMQEATEEGACGLAILSALNRYGWEVQQRAPKGDGFDYYVGEAPSDDDLPFQGLVRLEVSGILSGNADLIAARVRQKLDQLEVSNDDGTGFVAVIDFSGPTAHLEIVDES